MKMKNFFRLGQKGMTMVEVIVAFSVLMLTAAMFSRTLSLVERSMVRSGELLDISRDLQKGYYLSDGSVSNPDPTSSQLIFKNQNGGGEFRINATINKYTYTSLLSRTFWEVVAP